MTSGTIGVSPAPVVKTLSLQPAPQSSMLLPEQGNMQSVSGALMLPAESSLPQKHSRPLQPEVSDALIKNFEITYYSKPNITKPAHRAAHFAIVILSSATKPPVRARPVVASV